MSDRADLKAWQNRSCKTCALWGKPLERRALKDHYYPCNAPEPAIPDSWLAACFHVTIRRDYVTRDDGKKCPLWTP